MSPSDRYYQLVEQMQWMARQLQIFGVHVHVGVRSGLKVVPIVNTLQAYVPHLLALSASSPYWIGSDTGLASYRAKVFEGLPTAGLPYVLSGSERIRDLHGDSHLSRNDLQHPRGVVGHPTSSRLRNRRASHLRRPPTLFEIGVLAAVSQCLVAHMDEQLDRGHRLAVPPTWVVKENKWRAARHGIDADIITDEHGTTVALSESIIRLVDELSPTAHRLGCAEQLGSALEPLPEWP